jgi:hypothetical protein
LHAVRDDGKILPSSNTQFKDGFSYIKMIGWDPHLLPTFLLGLCPTSVFNCVSFIKFFIGEKWQRELAKKISFLLRTDKKKTISLTSENSFKYLHVYYNLSTLFFIRTLRG